MLQCVWERLWKMSPLSSLKCLFFLDKVKYIWCCFNVFPTFIGLLNKVRKNWSTKMVAMFLWMPVFSVLRSTCLVSYILDKNFFICSQSSYQLLPCQKNLLFLYKLPFGFGSHWLCKKGPEYTDYFACFLKLMPESERLYFNKRKQL